MSSLSRAYKTCWFILTNDRIIECEFTLFTSKCQSSVGSTYYVGIVSEFITKEDFDKNCLKIHRKKNNTCCVKSIKINQNVV